MVKDQDIRIIVASVLFLLMLMLEFPVQLIFNGLPLVVLSLSLLYIGIIVSYAVGSKRSFGPLFWIFIALFVVYLIGSSLEYNTFIPLYTFFFNDAIGVMAYFLLLFFFPVGFYLYYVAKRRRLAYLCFVLGFMIIWFYYGSGVFHIAFETNDESTIMLYSDKAFLNGTNPYTMNIAYLIYLYHVTLPGHPSFTLMPNNTLIGNSNYPALYFLSFIPFYLLGPPTIYVLEHTTMVYEAIAFIFLFFMAVYYALEKETLLKPDYLFYFVLITFLVNVASIPTYLMFALFLLAYLKLETNYGWLLLGLCASLQQELWLPVLMLIVYSYRNYGKSIGIKNLIGTIGVFAIINGYFFFLAPVAFIHSVFLPINECLLGAG